MCKVRERHHLEIHAAALDLIVVVPPLTPSNRPPQANAKSATNLENHQAVTIKSKELVRTSPSPPHICLVAAVGKIARNLVEA